MPRLRENGNLGVGHGCWGEAVACDFLRAKGYEIFERNATPYERDRRLEIDIVAYERASDTLVFVEVKQHKRFSPYASRLRSVNKRKLRNLRIVFNAWRRANRWDEGCRFDVIEIYGTPETGIEAVDHIESVRVFNREQNHINWR